MSLTGKILMTCDLARRYGIKDVDGETFEWDHSWYIKLSLAAFYKHIAIFLPQDGEWQITHRLNSS